MCGVVVVNLYVSLSVHLFGTHVLCDETKEPIANMLIPHERAVPLIFAHQQLFFGDVSFHPKFVLELTSTDFRYFFNKIKFLSNKVYKVSFYENF